MASINIYSEIAALIDAINAAKNANRYADANVLFAAALNLITRGGRLLNTPAIFRRHFVLEVLEGGDGYYDCLHIISSAHRTHTCIPCPMLRDELLKPAYAHCPRVERGIHERETDETLPDTWSDEMGGYMRMGEEALQIFFSESGRAQVEYLRKYERGELDVDTEPNIA